MSTVDHFLLKKRSRKKSMSEIDKLGIHARNFNEKVRVMNQTQSKQITLSVVEARNLHTEIFGLLSQIAELNDKLKDTRPSVSDQVVQIQMNGGLFK